MSHGFPGRLRKWGWRATVIAVAELTMAVSAPKTIGPIDPGLSGTLLRGRTVVIDPGHGGKDSGARGLIAHEDQINLAIALDLRQWLNDAGADVKMTWDKPGQILPSQKYRVQHRVNWINRTGGQALIDIHCNSAEKRWRGPQTFYWAGKGSYYLAYDVQGELQYFTHTRRPVTRIDQYVLRYARMPAINVEVGFISNPREEKLLMNPQYQRVLSWYIFLGIDQWFLKGRWPEHLLHSPPPAHFLVRD